MVLFALQFICPVKSAIVADYYEERGRFDLACALRSGIPIFGDGLIGYRSGFGGAYRRNVSDGTGYGDGNGWGVGIGDGYGYGFGFGDGWGAGSAVDLVGLENYIPEHIADGLGNGFGAGRI